MGGCGEDRRGMIEVRWWVMIVPWPVMDGKYDGFEFKVRLISMVAKAFEAFRLGHGFSESTFERA